MGQQAENSDRDIIHMTPIRDPRAGYRRGGPTEFGRENASACVAACFDELVPNVEDTCRQLQQPEYQRTRLWNLYCCDSLNCGVYIGSLGQSHPGPPATNYCASSTPNSSKTSLLPHTPTIVPSNIPAVRTWPTDSMAPHTVTSMHTSEIVVPLATTSVMSSDSTNTSSPTSTDVSSTGLSGGAKAAIGVFSVIAVLAITALLLLIFRKRRKQPKSSSPKSFLIPYGNGSYHKPRSGSQTPLITPTPIASSRSAPLTPPAKLSDRRYLQPVFDQGAPRPSASSSMGDLAFPSSPICAPAHTKPPPRHERRATTSSIRFPVTTTAAMPSHYPQSSVCSLGSGPGASTTTVESYKASSTYSGSATVTGTSTPPLSPTRVARAHDGPLESSDFATPAGPPPNRALPRPPPNHPNSPTFSVSPTSPRSPTFPARLLTRGASPVVPVQKGNNTSPPAPASTKELRDLTESYARETRESWGSWSGIGGGGPGVGPASRKRGSGSPQGCAEKKAETVTAMALQELNLEKLSGRY
ncbi:hypothetical protein HD806DRAFT_519783 [Xylariaceae sp. AK1471]|nr:hypothetical protein HD806DRAFT_519783 [Xylariaceae sp. AK1471]